MTVVARCFASTPARTSGETWEKIVSLISKESSEARRDLESAAGIAASIIADEIPKQAPFILAGNGPRLRIYCVFGEDAIVGDDCDERDLSWNPTDCTWRLLLPCAKEDIEQVQKALREKSARILAYDANEGATPEADSQLESKANMMFTINVKEFQRK